MPRHAKTCRMPIASHMNCRLTDKESVVTTSHSPEAKSLLPDWTSTSFCTPLGSAVEYRSLVAKAYATKLAAAAASPCPCTIRTRTRGRNAQDYGTAAEWAAVVERYLEAEQTGNPIEDDLESRMEVGKVPDSDPRLGLRGQRCIRAARDVSLNEELKYRVAPYAGFVVLDGEAKQLFGTEYEQVQDYAFNLDQVDKKCLRQLSSRAAASAFHGQGLRIATKSQLTVYAHADGRFGNPVRLINDSILDPRKATRHNSAPPNMRFFTVWFGGWPHVFVLPKRNIKKGEELLISYGSSYWPEHVRRTDARLRKEQKLGKNVS